MGVESGKFYGRQVGRLAGHTVGSAIAGETGAYHGRGIGGNIGETLGGLAGGLGFLKKGGRVKKTGKYTVHKGEFILPRGVAPTKSQIKKVRKRGGKA